MKNNKKGFTLIELIAVIIIIGLVALIAIPFFTGSFEDFKKNFYTNLSTTFVNGGKEFFADNSKYLPRRYLYSQKVSLGTLQDENYLKSFKDYKGGECDLERSYVIVIKLANKKYEYAPCLFCPGDSYENTNSPYCAADWNNDNLNITYELGTIGTQYVYKGTSRDALKEKLKVTLDVVKYNAAGEEIARVSGVGEEGIGIIYPSNLDTIDVNRVGEYPTEYTYQGITKTGKVIVYENAAPIVVANRNQSVIDKTKAIELASTTTDTSEYDKSGNTATPNDVWAQKLVYTMSGGTLTEPGVKITEFQWYIHERWETFCKITGNNTSCTRTIEEEMNETVIFRSLDSNGNFGAKSRQYVIRIDRTRPQCTLTFPDPDGKLDGSSKWYKADFTIRFAETKDTAKTVNGNNVMSGLVTTASSVLVNGTTLNATGVLGRTQATQTEDNEHFVWYGYVEDKAGNWNRCYNKVESGTSLKTPGTNDYLKKDKTPPTCSISATPDNNGESSPNGVSGSYTCVDATSKCKVASGTFSKIKSTTSYTMEDKAGNTSTCQVKVCTQRQNKTDTCSDAKRCSDAGCQTRYSCESSVCGAKTCTKSCCGTKTWYTYGSWSTKCNGANQACPGSTSSRQCGAGSWHSMPEFCCASCRSKTKHTGPKTCKKGSCCGWKSCVNNNCDCKTYKRSATKCGCNTWSRGSWHNVESCSESHCNSDNAFAEHQVCCRDTYYLCGKKYIYLTYDSEGGSACTAKTGTEGQKWGTLCTPTKTGSTFGGWYTQPHGQGTKITANTTVTGSLIVYADWGDTYLLTYNNQGGTGCTTKNGQYGEQWGDLCVPTKAGYTFVSWNTLADGSGDEIVGESIVDGDITVYAQYEPHNLYITYHVNGGELVGTNENIYVGAREEGETDDGFVTKDGNGYFTEYDYGATGINLANYNNENYVNIEKTGYRAKSGSEWNTKADGTGTSYNQATDYKYSDFCTSTTEDCDIVLYVNWEVATYTLTYNLDGGEVSTANPTSYTVNSSAITLNNPTKDGYTFAGWTGTNIESATTNVTIPSGSTGNKSYTANWTAKTILVTFDCNGGTGGGTQSFTYDVTGQQFSTTCSRAGYTLSGWNKQSNGSGAHYSATSGVSNNWIDSNSPSITLYAEWTPKTILVTFDCNGGTGGGTQSFTYDVTGQKFNTTCSKSGYTLNGWNKKNDGSGTHYTAASGVSNNWIDSNSPSITLYAEWTPHVLKISYYANSSSASWCGNSGSGYTMNSSKYAVHNSSTTPHTINYGASDNLWDFNDKSAVCFQVDWYTADDAATYIIHNSTTGVDTIVSQSTSYNAKTLAGYGGCNLDNGDCTITAKVNWRKTRLSNRYNCNGGTVVRKPSSNTKLPESLVGATGNPCCNGTVCAIGSSDPWDATTLADNGVRDHNYNTTNNGALPIQKAGCNPTNFWYIGYANSSYKIDENLTFSTLQSYAQWLENNSDKNYYTLLKHSDVVVDLYAQFSC